MKLTPIIILTKDNPEYLYVTLKSLTATNTENNPIIIVDDCSGMKKTIEMLYTNNTIKMSFDDWTIKDINTQEYADKTVGNIVLDIPKINKIFGIKNKFIVVKTPKYLGEHYRTLFGINLGFTLYPTAENVILLNDDVIFNKNWFTELKKMRLHESYRTDVAMMSNYNDILKPIEKNSILENDKIKGKICLFTNRFYKKLKEYDYFSTSNLKEIGTAYELLQNIAYKLGFSCFVSTFSWAQSLEKRNMVNKDKVLKFEETFIKPVAWNKDF